MFVSDCGQILIVDGDRDFRNEVAALLARAGFEARPLATGEEALAAASRLPPGAVILDVHLPEISGYEVCRELRDRFGDSLPIVFVSANRKERADRVAGLLVGADDYLAKPIAADELLAVHELLGRHMGRLTDLLSPPSRR
jgi:two-component system OmpR family response regulator